MLTIRSASDRRADGERTQASCKRGGIEKGSKGIPRQSFPWGILYAIAPKKSLERRAFISLSQLSRIAQSNEIFPPSLDTPSRLLSRSLSHGFTTLDDPCMNFLHSTTINPERAKEIKHRNHERERARDRATESHDLGLGSSDTNTERRTRASESYACHDRDDRESGTRSRCPEPATRLDADSVGPGCGDD